MKMLKKLKLLIASKSGAGMLLFALFIIPLVTFTTAIAIDANMYIGIKSYLNNALDTIATSALNRSARDAYRSDKILNINQELFKQKLGDEIEANLKTGPVSGDEPYTVQSNISFLKGHDITIQTAFDGGGGDEYKDSDTNLVEGRHTTQDVTLTLKTKVDLPILSSIMKIFGLGQFAAVDMNVENTVRGVRVQKPNENTY